MLGFLKALFPSSILNPFSADSSENEEYRRELCSISPLKWYSLLDSIIFHHAPERVEEIDEFHQTFLLMFEAEQRHALRFWIRVSIANESQRKGEDKTRPDTRHKMRLVCVLFTFENNTEPTDGRTDGPTDRRTDITSYRDATAHLKKESKREEDGEEDEEEDGLMD